MAVDMPQLWIPWITLQVTHRLHELLGKRFAFTT